MKAKSEKQRGMPQLKLLCPSFAAAAREYEAALRADDLDRAAQIFQRLQTIAQAFWTGVDFGLRNGRRDRIRVWRKNEP